MTATEDDCRFRPLTGISLFLSYTSYYNTIWNFVFVPSRGFLFFYKGKGRSQSADWFSSPHGDFSFSIVAMIVTSFPAFRFSSPHGDFSFSIRTCKNISKKYWTVFVPSRGFLFFYRKVKRWNWWMDYVFVPSRGFLFFYQNKSLVTKQHSSFRPLTGISLFL